jgi:hypothetical protein
MTPGISSFRQGQLRYFDRANSPLLAGLGGVPVRNPLLGYSRAILPLNEGRPRGCRESAAGGETRSASRQNGTGGFSRSHSWWASSRHLRSAQPTTICRDLRGRPESATNPTCCSRKSMARVSLREPARSGIRRCTSRRNEPPMNDTRTSRRCIAQPHVRYRLPLLQSAVLGNSGQPTPGCDVVGIQEPQFPAQ